MFDAGFFELLLIAIIALIVLGPDRLPHAARMTGALIGKLRRTMADVKAELNYEVGAQEMQQRIKANMQQGIQESGLQEMHDHIHASLNEAGNEHHPRTTPPQNSPPKPTGQTDEKPTDHD